MNLQVPDFPKRLEIELVSKCNLKCIYCPRRYLDELNGYISFELFQRIIEEVPDPSDCILTLHRRGESMLHPDIIRILNLVGNKKFKDVQLATNATLLTKDKYDAIINGLSFISFSIDTPDDFDRIRVPAKYEKVERNIIDFLKYNKGRVKTQVSMVKTDDTSEEKCELFMRLWHDRVDRVRVYEEHSSDGKFGAIKGERGERKPCVMPFYEMLIYDNGTIGRCNHDWNGEPLGDINNTTIKEIWHSSIYNHLREQHKTLNITDEVCKNCDSWYAEVGVQGTGITVEKK